MEFKSNITLFFILGKAITVSNFSSETPYGNKPPNRKLISQGQFNHQANPRVHLNGVD
jgi:hypothetical protein